MGQDGQEPGFSLYSHGIRVVTIAPGYTNKISEEPKPLEMIRIRSISSKIPMGRFATTEEIGEAIVFLASGKGGIHYRNNPYIPYRSTAASNQDSEVRSQNKNSRI